MRTNDQSDSGSWRWAAALTCSGPNRPAGLRPGESARRCGREAAVGAVIPLHGGAHGEPALDVEVLAHADLLAVEQRRGAGQREHQRVDEPDAALVATEHGREPAAQAAAVELHVRVGPERGEDLLALGGAQLVEGQLVVVAHEVGPLARDVERGALAQRGGERAGIPAGEREVEALHPDEVELHVQPVAVGAAEEVLLLRVGQVDLAEQGGVAEPPGHEVAHVLEVAPAGRSRRARSPG